MLANELCGSFAWRDKVCLAGRGGGEDMIFIGTGTKDIVRVKPFFFFSSVPHSFPNVFVSGSFPIDTWVVAFNLLRNDAESDEGLEALLGSTLKDGTIRALQAPRTVSKQVASGVGLKVEVGDIFDGVSSSLSEAEGWVESGIPANLVAGIRVAVETLDTAFKVVD